MARPLLSFDDATMSTSTQIRGHFLTRPGACPNYSGKIQAGGFFGVTASKKGYPYRGGGSLPTPTVTTVGAGGSVVVDIDLPATGRLQVNVVDESSTATIKQRAAELTTRRDEEEEKARLEAEAAEEKLRQEAEAAAAAGAEGGGEEDAAPEAASEGDSA